MARYLQMQVPSPCKENWNNMRPHESGRHCFSCQKSGTDFTQMTDNELLNYFKSHQGSTCGRFTESQLNKAIPYPGKPLPWIKYFFKFTLPAFLLSFKSTGETVKLPTPTEIAPVKYRAPVEDTVKKREPLSGFVYDNTGAPLAFATVMVKNTSKGASTNAEGRFTLDDVDLPVTLVVSYVGFMPSEFKLSSSQQLTNIKLQLAPAVLGEVVFVGYVIPVKTKRKAQKEKKTEKALSTESGRPAPVPNMTVYPNPIIAGSSLNLQCRSFEKGNYLAELYTLSGQLVKASKVTYDKKDTRITLPIDKMLSGTYFLQLTHENGKHYSQQVVIRE